MPVRKSTSRKRRAPARTRSRKPAASRATVETLAQQFAAVLVPDVPDFDAVVDESPAAPLFERLCELLRRERDHPGTPQQIQAAYDRLCKALPKAQQREFAKYDDARNFEEIITREASYRVGVAVGRRQLDLDHFTKSGAQ